MKTGPDATTIYRIARYYYKDGLSQDLIAKREGYSRSQVSRLLEKARELGIVKIELVPPSGSGADSFAALLEKRLGLRTVIAAPISAGGDGTNIARTIATAGAEFVAETIASHKVIGIGWGRTVYAVSELIPYAAKEGEHRFVPLVGTSGDDDPNLQINTIIDRFSSKFRSRGLFVNMPAVREKGAALSHIERERISNLNELWDSVEVAVVGLGDPPKKNTKFITELPAAYRTALCESGCVGDILSQFFDATGEVFKVRNA